MSRDAGISSLPAATFTRTLSHAERCILRQVDLITKLTKNCLGCSLLFLMSVSYGWLNWTGVWRKGCSALQARGGAAAGGYDTEHSLLGDSGARDRVVRDVLMERRHQPSTLQQFHCMQLCKVSVNHPRPSCSPGCAARCALCTLQLRGGSRRRGQRCAGHWGKAFTTYF